jgi:hypothetical protein
LDMFCDMNQLPHMLQVYVTRHNMRNGCMLDNMIQVT